MLELQRRTYVEYKNAKAAKELKDLPPGTQVIIKTPTTRNHVSGGAQPQYSAGYTIIQRVTGGYMVEHSAGGRRKVAKEHVFKIPKKDFSARNILAHPEPDLSVDSPFKTEAFLLQQGEIAAFSEQAPYSGQREIWIGRVLNIQPSGIEVQYMCTTDTSENPKFQNTWVTKKRGSDGHTKVLREKNPNKRQYQPWTGIHHPLTLITSVELTNQNKLTNATMKWLRELDPSPFGVIYTGHRNDKEQRR
jgi:hypothetical protein